MSARDFLGLGAIFLANTVANKSGIGGGGIMIPILILVLRFSSIQAVALSNLAVLAGASTNLYSNLNKRHPDKALNRPLVDWSIIMIMEPATMLTAVFGAYLGKMLPPLVLFFLLTIVLGVVAIRTFFRGVMQYHEEEDSRSAFSSIIEMPRENESFNFNINAGNEQIIAIQREFSWEQSDISIDRSYVSYSSIEKSLQEILEKESFVPFEDLFLLISLTLCIVFLTLIKSNVTCGGFWYMVDLFLIVIITLTFAIYYRSVVINRWYRKLEAGYIPVDGDVEWTERNSILYPIYCCFAGLLAGIFGVGGGLLKGPLMLELGVLPAVASATSGVMILFTSAAATSSFFILGNFDGVYIYAAVIFLLAMSGTLIGQAFVQIKRPSFITLMIASIVSASAVMLVFETVEQLEGETWSQLWKIGRICNTRGRS